MLPRAGFPELSNADLAAAVDYMISTLRARVAPRAKIEGAPVGGITVEAREGRVALRGMVDTAQVVRDAEEAALGVAGVAGVDNHLIPADLFEHD